MLTLHIANKNYSSWSLRPWMLLTELGIPFREKLSPFGVGGSREVFRAFSPSGKVPCLHDGDEVVWDSLAIAEHLAERHAGVWPVDASARTWARCASAEMHAGFAVLRQQCSMTCGLRVRLHQMPPALLADITRLNELWCEGLERFGGPFLAGERFTAVDAFYAPVAFRIQTYGLPMDDAAAAYASRLLALPSMQRWYAEALQEPMRDHGHELDTLRVGTVLEDRRAG
jgi:glutathione S-transferase